MYYMIVPRERVAMEMELATLRRLALAYVNDARQFAYYSHAAAELATYLARASA